MAELNETPKGNRLHIAFFGLRNAGKSTLVNEFTNQNLAIVNARAGTTTDPVSKAMEIAPLGPCLITDTAGLDDCDGELGAMRVKKSLAVLATTDLAVWVSATADDENSREKNLFDEMCREKKIATLIFRRGDTVAHLKEEIAKIKIADEPRPLIADLISRNDCVVCVCPIDDAAPRARLILPQQQVIREILDAHANAIVCRETELEATLKMLAKSPRFVVTDSQVFATVAKIVPAEIPLTSFSIIFARAKGDLAIFCEGARALANLKDGDCVLVSEGCTHHRQCEDIGTVKLPRWISGFSRAKVNFEFASGNDFPADLSRFQLVVQCGACMLTRRQVQNRIHACRAAGVPIVNYGLAIATCNGLSISSDTCRVSLTK